MYKESLFELIRKEEVIIWAGAGLSLYAGYPSGKKLAEIFVNNLTIKEKECLDVSIPLPDLAEEIYRLKGNNKNSIIGILNEIFLKTPISKETHQNMSIIPHFKTIVTTNYDSLFEDTYGQEAQLIYNTAQIPYINKKKVQVFKVHGDLSDPDSIILTRSDFNNFFKDNKDNGTLWSVIRERLATNTILFLGYNLEDPNFSVIFERISESLGDNRKEAFLVAPELPQHKINNLIRKRIHYINSTADEFISELIIHLKEHIISDIERGNTSADTFRTFLSKIDLLPELKADKNAFRVSSIKGTKEGIHGTANFTFKNESDDFIKELDDFTQGRRFGTFKIPEDKLVSANFSYGGVKFPNAEGISRLEFKSKPKVELKIDVRFEDGFEFTDLPIKIYASQSVIELHLELENAEIIVRLNETNPGFNIELKYKHKEICKNVKNEIELYSLLNNLSAGRVFTVYPDYGLLTTRAFPKSTEFLDHTSFFLNYFKNLKKIEDFFGIRFTNIPIDEVDESTIKNVEYIISVLENDYVIRDWEEELTMTLIDDYTDEIVHQFEIVNETGTPIVAQQLYEEIIELHGKEISLGFMKVEFLNSFIINLKDIIERKDNTVRVISQSKKIKVSFVKELK